MRCFCAIDLAPAVRDAVRAWWPDRAVDSMARSVRWVADDAWHITLKFLGDVDDDAVGALRAALERAVAATPRFDLRVRGAGAFPARGRPRVLWAGIDGDLATCRHLAAEIDAACTGLGFAAETRPFTPHVTLGRVRRGRVVDAAAVEAWRVAGATLDVALPVVERVTLFESRLSDRGARYEAIAEFSLGPGACEPETR